MQSLNAKIQSLSSTVLYLVTVSCLCPYLALGLAHVASVAVRHFESPLGKYGDFVVLNKDYFTIPEEEIPTAFPLMTVLGGRTIVLRKEFADELGTQPVGPQMNFEFATKYTAEGGAE